MGKGMPKVTITFTELAGSAIKRGERGIVALILKDTVLAKNPVECTGGDIPTALSTKSRKQIELALMGYIKPPKKVIAYILSESAEDYTDAYNYLRTTKYNYLVVPTAETDGEASSVAAFVKREREDGKMVKAILPNYAGDSEAVINYATEKVVVGENEYTTEEYCSRVAGIIAGTPLSMSATYAALPEATDCTRLTKDERDAAVDAGKLIVFWDGEKVKVGRAVNSLTTISQEKNEQFQKIAIVDAMDMMKTDITATIEDVYIGKYKNSYDNKCILIRAIGAYLDTMVAEQVISNYTVEIDIEANRAYLKGKGIDVDSMSEHDIKTAKTGSSVFLKATMSMLDAIEDVVMNITI